MKADERSGSNDEDDDDDDQQSILTETTSTATQDLSTHSTIASSIHSVGKANVLQQLLLTPMDADWDAHEQNEKDAHALRRREVGRREKYAADLALLTGSPLDAYQRCLKAAELAKSGTPDQLWYAAAM